MQKAKGYVQWLNASKLEGRKPVTDYNCKLVSSGTVIKGQILVSAKSEKKNAWRLRNYIDNVQEEGRWLFCLCNVDLQRSYSRRADKITGFER